MKPIALALGLVVGCQSRRVDPPAVEAPTRAPFATADAGDARGVIDAATKTCAALPASCKAVPAPSDASITLRRGACFGSCPAYSVTVRADGTVMWVGEDHVTKRGAATGKADPKEAKALLDFATSACFFEMQNTYDARMLDLPAVDISVTIGAQSKNVHLSPADRSAWSNAPCKPPAALFDLPGRIDTLAGTATWIGHR